MISQLPTRILKLLEFIGFSGNKQLGLQELEIGCRQWDTLRGPLCSIVLITYHTFILFILGTYTYTFHILAYAIYKRRKLTK